MLPHKHNKYSLFKSNRSQASLLSNLSHQSTADRDRDRDRPVSYQASPIDSPLHSPAFPPSIASSPLSQDDRDRDDSLARSYDADPAKFYYPPNSPTSQSTVPRRTQSQRTPPSQHAAFTRPTINLVAPTTPGTAAPQTINEHPDASSRQPPVTIKTELRKKGRFFGLAGSSSAREPANSPTADSPPQSVGRSISVRRSVHQTPIVTTAAGYVPQLRPSGSSSATFPSPTINEVVDSGVGVNSPYGQYIQEKPPTPAKDPPRSPAGYQFPSGEDYNYNQAPTESATTANSNQPPAGEQAGSHKPTAWERAGRQPGHHRNLSSEQPQQYQHFQPPASSASSTTSHQPPSRGTQDLAYPQPPFSSSRPSSRQSYDSPSPVPFHQRTPSLQQNPNAQMVPPPQSHQGGRTQESVQQIQQGGREGNYQPYQQGQGGNQPGQQYGSQLAVNVQQSNSHRGTPQPPPMAPQNSNPESENAPLPSRSRDDLSGLDVQQLLGRHEELNEKYRKVKKYYFDKDAQVQQLQNTIAHQRLAQSRTSLDDNEYATRFNRLDGAINNLAFNIRKDWLTVPPWLAPYVNKDATSTVTKEMTAVGRACISRWLVDEIFDRFFHPSLEPNLSSQLKIIERNLRRFAPPSSTEEERESLLAKISNWRLSTLDGLHDMLNSPTAQQYRQRLTEEHVKLLTEDLLMNLKEPHPSGLEVGVVGIVELAVGIAANLPLESRDVFVDYVMPGQLVNESIMKVEGQLPPLINPGQGDNDVMDRASVGSTSEKDDLERDSTDIPISSQQQAQQQLQLQQQQQQQQMSQQKKKGGMFGNLIGGKKAATAAPPGSRGAPIQPEERPPVAPEEDRVRFAAFMAVQVRQKNMLVKAPVYI